MIMEKLFFFLNFKMVFDWNVSETDNWQVWIIWIYFHGKKQQKSKIIIHDYYLLFQMRIENQKLKAKINNYFLFLNRTDLRLFDLFCHSSQLLNFIFVKNKFRFSPTHTHAQSTHTLAAKSWTSQGKVRLCGCASLWTQLCVSVTVRCWVALTRSYLINLAGRKRIPILPPPPPHLVTTISS